MLNKLVCFRLFRSVNTGDKCNFIYYFPGLRNVMLYFFAIIFPFICADSHFTSTRLLNITVAQSIVER